MMTPTTDKSKHLRTISIDLWKYITGGYDQEWDEQARKVCREMGRKAAERHNRAVCERLLSMDRRCRTCKRWRSNRIKTDGDCNLVESCGPEFGCVYHEERPMSTQNVEDTYNPLEKDAPLLWCVLTEIARCRAKWESVLGPSSATIEVWFSPEAWNRFLVELDGRMAFGYMCLSGESYGAMCGGAECFCLNHVPVDGDFTMRLRLE